MSILNRGFQCVEWQLFEWRSSVYMLGNCTWANEKGQRQVSPNRLFFSVLSVIAELASNLPARDVMLPTAVSDAHVWSQTNESSRPLQRSQMLRKLQEVNGELWLILSLFALAGVVNFLVASQRVMLGLYTLPTIVSAYLYGRRHATLTALASVLMIVILTWFNPDVLSSQSQVIGQQWMDVIIWGGTLMIAGYLTGTLCDHKTSQVIELRETYNGVLMILRHFISKDPYTENHSYRVSVYASRIAEALRFSPQRIEDIRAAALLHDIGKLEVSREVLYKAARLTEVEVAEIRAHVNKGVAILEPIGGSLRRVIPIILAHHDKFDGSGYRPTKGDDIPIEARIIAVADVYDALTSDRPYRKAMPPFEARELIVKGSGTEFDPEVVEAFLAVFRRGEMEVPFVAV
jgi:putative nucleotidyltransferase with HDIG domain